MKTVTAETKREIIDSVTSGKLSVQTAAIRYQVPEVLIQVWAGNPDAIKPKVVPHPSTQTQPTTPYEPIDIPDIPHVAPAPPPTVPETAASGLPSRNFLTKKTLLVAVVTVIIAISLFAVMQSGDENPITGDPPGQQISAINNIADESSISQAVGLVQIAVEITRSDNTVFHSRVLYKAITKEELEIEFEEEQVKLLLEEDWTFEDQYIVSAGGTGSCFLVTEDGYAITNQHVVEDFIIAKSQTALYKELAGENLKAIRLELYVYLDSVPHVAELIYVSDQYDLAILKINEISNRPFFRIAKTNIIPRQTDVTSLGFPGTSRTSISWEEQQQDQRNDQSGDPRKWYKDNDLQYVATSGEVSKVGNREGLGTVVQHTATIDRGNSGGPLICDDGTVIGINTWGLSSLSADGIVEGTAVNLSLSIYSVINEIKRNDIKVSWVEELTSSDE
tara:strand:- start:618 stop:1961 length:1344 start_codon:yes stop_codon:yes gene_type:complete